MQTVCVIGLGYIGLPTAALLANSAYQVHGVDVVPSVVETINGGGIHIIEPDLDTFVRAAVGSGRLRASTVPAEADVFIIAVPTPFHAGYVPNVDYVVAATKAMAPFVRPGNRIILESTSPVGTTELVEATLTEAGADTTSLFIAYCPERVLPGHVMRELIENDRVVGGLNPESTRQVAAFYRTFVKGEVLETDSRTAEMTKLTENASRDVQIAFANELSMICDEIGINVWELIRLANKHPRVNILRPGPGVGGHCIAVDPWFIVHRSPERSRLIRQAREVNVYKQLYVQEKIMGHVAELTASLGRKPIVAAMGLAFKPDIDDLRESPALEIAHHLAQAAGLLLICVEPHVDAAPHGLPLVSAQEAIEQADLVVYLVAHSSFKTLRERQGQVVLDICGLGK
jgi:UDP-N-acetyl-D-mannosaminuronic acid dehydrogenase